MTSSGYNMPSTFCLSNREMQNIVIVQNIFDQRTVLSKKYLIGLICYYIH